ncbi:MAG: hypothetical protein SFV23_26320, partial [Planctomycetaceae bacterium]|nr:hypothetical protein [Planctomycetaceae bacterium]
HSNYVLSVAWNHDGSRIASASADKTVRIWDPSDPQHPLLLQGHSSAVNSVAWNHDGSRIASASRDGTVRIWDAAGTCLAVLAPAPAGWAAYRPSDGRYRCGGDVGGRVYHAAGLCRFELGELDPLLPGLRLRDDEAWLEPGELRAKG